MGGMAVRIPENRGIDFPIKISSAKILKNAHKSHLVCGEHIEPYKDIAIKFQARLSFKRIVPEKYLLASN